MASRANRLTEEERARILELHAAGRTRNDIARMTGRAPGTITNVVSANGGTFERAAEVQAATSAQQADNRARRAAIVARLYGRTEANLDRLEAPVYEWKHVTPEGITITVQAPDPSAQDERNHANSITAYLQAAARLEVIDSGDDAGGVRSMLAGLAEGIARAVQEEDTEGA